MTSEDKQLLLVDLCARLPYGVKINLNNGNDVWTLNGIFEGNHTGIMLILESQHFSKDIIHTSNWPLSLCKPYLRPMSSMTEEEIIDFLQVPDLSQVSKKFISDFKIGNFGIMANMSKYARNIDWLNMNMFDYRGLIDKGLAIEVTEDYNPYKV